MLDPVVLLTLLNIVLSLALTGLALLMLRFVRHGRIRGPFFWILASAAAFTTHTLGYSLGEVFEIFDYPTALFLNEAGHAVALSLLIIGMYQLARIWARPPRRLPSMANRGESEMIPVAPSMVSGGTNELAQNGNRK